MDRSRPENRTFLQFGPIFCPRFFLLMFGFLHRRDSLFISGNHLFSPPQYHFYSPQFHFYHLPEFIFLCCRMAFFSSPSLRTNRDIFGSTARLAGSRCSRFGMQHARGSNTHCSKHTLSHDWAANTPATRQLSGTHAGSLAAQSSRLRPFLTSRLCPKQSRLGPSGPLRPFNCGRGHLDGGGQSGHLAGDWLLCQRPRTHTVGLARAHCLWTASRQACRAKLPQTPLLRRPRALGPRAAKEERAAASHQHQWCPRRPPKRCLSQPLQRLLHRRRRRPWRRRAAAGSCSTSLGSPSKGCIRWSTLQKTRSRSPPRSLHLEVRGRAEEEESESSSDSAAQASSQPAKASFLSPTPLYINNII